MAEAKGTSRETDALAAATLRIAELERELAALRNASDAADRGERRYRALVKATSHAAWICDSNGFDKDARAWWSDLTGQTQPQGQGWGWLDVVHPDDREMARAAWERARDTGIEYDSSFRVLSRSGEWRSLRCRGVPLADGREWVGIFIDETDRSRLGDELSDSQERFRTLFNLAAVAVAEGGLDGRFLAVNRRMVELTGYSEAELLERTFLDITHPEDRTDNSAVFDSLLRGEKNSYTLEKRYVRKDGSVAWVESHVSLVRDRQGKPLHTIAIIKDRTAIRTAEEAIRCSAARLRLVADSVPALISYIDPDYRYLMANKEYENWFQISASAVEGRTVVEVLGEEAFAKVRGSMEQALAGKRVQFEGWAPYKAGSRYIRASYIPDFNAQQQVAGFAVLVEDLTEDRAAAELAATLNEQLEHKVRDFEELFETMPIPVAIARDAEAQDIRVNSAFAEILGVAPDDTNVSASNTSVGQPFRFVREGVDVPAEELPQQRAQREGKRVDGAEFDVLRADGNRWRLFGSAVPLFDEQGSVRGSIAAFIDVTEQKRAEHALRDSEQRLRRLIDTSPFGIGIGTFEGGFVFANESLLKMTGYTKEDVDSRAMNWKRMTPPEWLALDERAARELRQYGASTPFEKEYICKDGSRIPILMGCCLLNEPFAEQEQVVGFYIDLTQRRTAEAGLQSSNDELRRINLDLEQFAYAAAHDLQEPLRMVSLYTQLFARRFADHVDPAVDMMIRQIIGSSQRAQSLVSDLLTYTRVIHESTDDCGIADCNDVVREVLSNLSASIQECGAHVSVDELPCLRISRSHLLQLLQNLLSNALKYAKPGVPPVVSVTSEKVHHGCQIRVQDNGIGIKHEYQEKIFGIFKRLHGQNVPGTGIGLAICRRIVERYKGHIWVESRGEGEGSTFVFQLPDAD